MSFSKRPKRKIKHTKRARESLESGEISSSAYGERSHLNSKVVSRTSDRRIPGFSTDDWRVYDWPSPWPRSFLNLSQSHKRWKERTDQLQKDEDVDDGSDDWTVVCGAPGISLPYVVANVLLHRAKRAFWANQRWDEFETQEKLLTARREVEATKLVIFDILKFRLCEEIWLEPYQESFSPRFGSPQILEDSKEGVLEDPIDFETSDEGED